MKNKYCKYNLTKKNCTYWPEFKGKCVSKCPNYKDDIEPRLALMRNMFNIGHEKKYNVIMNIIVKKVIF